VSGVTDRDHGYAALKRDLDKLARSGVPVVYVGILQDVGSEMTESGITLAGYAAANEFGTKHIPERSFMRSTVADHAAEYQKELDEAVGGFVDAALRFPGSGNRTLEYGLGRLGLRVTRDIQNKIRAGGDPYKKNADITLKRKYPANVPLKHTGRMRQSISHLVVMNNRSTGTLPGQAAS
jgi:hypothetical protein